MDDEIRRIELLKFFLDEGLDEETAKQMTDSAMEGEKMAQGGRVGMQEGDIVTPKVKNKGILGLLEKLFGKPEDPGNIEGEKELLEKLKAEESQLTPKDVESGLSKLFFKLMGRPENQYAQGGRVGMQEGGETEYETALRELREAQGELPKDSISVTQKSPGIEALLEVYGPNLANLLKTPVKPGGVEGLYGSFLPEIAAQDPAQTKAYNLALAQAYGGPGGVAQYQQFLNQAGKDISGLSSAAQAGQNVGLGGIQTAQGLANLGAGATVAGQDAGAQALANAQAQANLMSQAAAAGQGAGTADFDAARAFTGPQGYQDFMSPYQQEVIDATRADYEQELARQQAQLGLGAGQAFGGSRFGVAQGELGAQGAQGLASTLAGLRQQGFTQAQQAAAQAAAQRLGLGQAAMQQAGQNVGLYGQGLQGQQAMAQGLQQQAAQNLGLFGQGIQQQLAGSQAAQQQAAQNVGLMGQAGQAQMGLAQLQPQLAMQNIGFLDQLGKQQQLQAQAKIDAEKQGAKMLAYEPYDRYGFFGGQLTGIMGGYPGGTSYSSQMQQTPNTFQQLLGGIGTVAGIGMGLNNAGFFGGK